MSPLHRILGCIILTLFVGVLCYERAVNARASQNNINGLRDVESSTLNNQDITTGTAIFSGSALTPNAEILENAILEVPAPPNLYTLFPVSQPSLELVQVALAEEPIPYIFASSDMIARHSEPAYPASCLHKASNEEFVSIRFRINERGWVVAPGVAESTNTCFDSAAIQAARRTRFHEAVFQKTSGDFLIRYSFEKPDFARRID